MMNKQLNIILGAFILLYLLYSRLFRIRISKELTSHLDLITILLFSIILFTMIFLFIYNLFNLYKARYNLQDKAKSNYFSCIKNLLIHPKNPLFLWTNSLKALDIYLKNKTPDYDIHKNYSDYIIGQLANCLIRYKKLSFVTLITLRIIPQLIVCIAFIVDVVIQQKFYYFYHTLGLLIIPMIISYILYSINVNTDTNLTSLDTVISLKIIAKEGLDSSIPLHDPINFSKAMPITIAQWYEITQREAGEEIYCFNVLKDELISQTTLLEQPDILEYCVDTMNMFFTFKSYIVEFNTYKEKIEIPFNIFKYALYVFSWMYIIYYGF